MQDYHKILLGFLLLTGTAIVNFANTSIEEQPILKINSKYPITYTYENCYEILDEKY